MAVWSSDWFLAARGMMILVFGLKGEVPIWGKARCRSLVGLSIDHGGVVIAWVLIAAVSQQPQKSPGVSHADVRLGGRV